MISRAVAAARAGGKVLAKEIVAFGVVGVVNIFINLGIFNVLTSGLGWAVVRSSIIATVISTTTSYFMNRHWSFSHRARTGLRREYLLFFTINGLATVIESGVVAFVEYGLGLTDPLSRNLAKLVGIGIGTVIRFFAYKRWVFTAVEPAQER